VSKCKQPWAVAPYTAGIKYVTLQQEHSLNLDKLITIAEKQEEILCFDRFSRADAWELGNRIVKRIQESGLALSVSIRLFNGIIVFQYLPEGTSRNNESWLRKKYNVVKEFETSSLLNTLRFAKWKWTFEERGLNPARYAWGGGGFPIRLRGSAVIGAALASGLPHLQDHGILVDSIAGFLGVEDVPHIPLNVNI
jgi:uncharacterized protein (UPF0303 family)